MEKSNKTIKYFAYVRKSTEGEERQALSISSQMDKVKEFFADLEIVEVLEERHSAFKPYNRPVFASMVKRIQRGEASGIIAWHPDRLSRNEIDASTITYMVRTGVIRDLKFGSYNFDNSPEGIMMLQMALSQSQYFSSKLGKDVRRGLEKKFDMGWQPNMCPNGYKNKIVEGKGYSIIETDPKRFKTMQKAFALMLTGSKSVPEVLDTLNNDWGFKTKIRGGKLTRSSLYRIFTNLFYAGIIEYGGKQKMGNHKAMITLEEYDRIQTILGRKGKPRNKKNDFAYTGLMKCAVCGCSISADLKRKINKTTGKQREYTYYCCTHKKAGFNCHEGAVEVKELETQIDNELKKYELQAEFRELFFKIAEENKKDNPEDKDQVIKEMNNSIEKLKIEKINLTRLSCKNLIPDDEFTLQRNEYEREIIDLSQKLGKLQKNIKQDDEAMAKVNFATDARTNFQEGDNKDKKNILLEIGANRELKDRKLIITPYKWLIPIEKIIKPLEAKYFTLELNKTPLNTKQNEAYTSLCRELRRGRDSNPRAAFTANTLAGCPIRPLWHLSEFD